MYRSHGAADDTDALVQHFNQGGETVGCTWCIGDNPMTAVYKFLETNKDFKIDKGIHEKLQISVAPYGYLKCSRD